MKRTYFFLLILFLSAAVKAQTGTVGIGTNNPNASAALDIQSNNKGVLIPRLTSVQRNAISSPAIGLLVFDNTTNSFWFRNATTWVELTDAETNVWRKDGDNAISTAAANVGIGTLLPQYKFDVSGTGRFSQDLNINRDLWVDRNLDVDGTSNFFGAIAAGSNLSVSGNVSVSGNTTTNGGRGIVRSTNSLQLTVSFPSGAVGFTNAPPGHTQDVQFVLPDVFSSAPLISMAQVLNQSGNFEHWTLSIHSVDVATNRFWVRFYNASPSNSTFTATFRFIAIGAAQ